MILRPKREWGSDLEWERGVWEGEKMSYVERDRGEMREMSRKPYRNLNFSMDQELSKAV